MAPGLYVLRNTFNPSLRPLPGAWARWWRPGADCDQWCKWKEEDERTKKKELTTNRLTEGRYKLASSEHRRVKQQAEGKRQGNGKDTGRSGQTNSFGRLEDPPSEASNFIDELVKPADESI